jgi:hypothetical protein
MPSITMILAGSLGKFLGRCAECGIVLSVKLAGGAVMAWV